MKFDYIYPFYVQKADKKERTKEEVDQIIMWLTGYDNRDIQRAITKQVSLGDFFNDAPMKNPNRKLITGVVCGIRVEDIDEPLMQEIRYLDKLVDELARGKAMEKILRT
ncbi:MAG: DUF2200 domain-containing protein [Patescibacteria group bacterium]